MTPKSLPPSFAALGFQAPAIIGKAKLRRQLIGISGAWDTGKTELALSAPGPLLAIGVDRGLQAILDNPDPPATRCQLWAAKMIPVPMQGALSKEEYAKLFNAFYAEYKAALSNPDCRSMLLDGDSDTWDWQRLGEFGRLSKVPSILYENVNASRRAMYMRAHDSGKIVLATNRVRKLYVTKMRADGQGPELSEQGNEIRVWNGDWERVGFSDQDYLWNIQLTTDRRLNRKGAPEWGCTIKKCKASAKIVGQQLWGADCNLQTLFQVVYPQIPLSEWGY